MNNPIQQLNKVTSEAGSKATSLAGKHLKSRNVTFTDQLQFANFSGDTNPIHIDPVAARRTISGQCIMHGIHGLLWALDTLSECTGLTATNLKVRFIKPIFLNETISCIWEEQTKQLSLISGDIVLSVATLRLGSLKSVNTIQTKIETPRSKPREPTFIECSSLERQPFAIYGDTTLAKTLFPSFVKAYGIAAACEIAAISEVIGMECPGLHSLFTTLQVDFRLDSDSIPNFTIKKSDERFNLLQIFIEAHTLTGEAEAFYRPPPSSNLRITELRTFVHEDEFKNVCALIVGGSRGLGEVVAKLITAGGGKSIITYSVGSADAARVQREIMSFGGYCETMQLTIGETVSLPSRLWDFNQLYYFATPKIFGKRSSKFDNVLFSNFSKIYVDGFNQLCRAIAAQKQHIAVLYPSSIAVEKPLPELLEYAAAKSKGEELCKILNETVSFSILFPRLPRIATDQTLSLVKAPSADAVEVLLPLIRKMTMRSDARLAKPTSPRG